MLFTLQKNFQYFNPRSPHGERHTSRGKRVPQLPFQSTLPARGATQASNCIVQHEQFQSTLPARGATRCERVSEQAAVDFNPRSPHGERRLPLRTVRQPARFQSTLPARGATAGVQGISVAALSISIHAPRTGSDSHEDDHAVDIRNFNPRSPHGERRR